MAKKKKTKAKKPSVKQSDAAALIEERRERAFELLVLHGRSRVDAAKLLRVSVDTVLADINTLSAGLTEALRTRDPASLIALDLAAAWHIRQQALDGAAALYRDPKRAEFYRIALDATEARCNLLRLFHDMR